MKQVATEVAADTCFILVSCLVYSISQTIQLTKSSQQSYKYDTNNKFKVHSVSKNLLILITETHDYNCTEPLRPVPNRTEIDSACTRSTEEVYHERSRVEAASNTSIVALRVVGGDEKGSDESEIVKYDHESHGTRTRE
jgi:hypothetical protein